MAKQTETVVCRFYQLIPDAPIPRPADRSADGMLPTRGYRYCEALAVASALGWYIPRRAGGTRGTGPAMGTNLRPLRVRGMLAGPRQSDAQPGAVRAK
jgi:hypothetical protein